MKKLPLILKIRLIIQGYHTIIPEYGHQLLRLLLVMTEKKYMNSHLRQFRLTGQVLSEYTSIQGYTCMHYLLSDASAL
jgi:hypothetical protein